MVGVPAGLDGLVPGVCLSLPPIGVGKCALESLPGRSGGRLTGLLGGSLRTITPGGCRVTELS